MLAVMPDRAIAVAAHILGLLGIEKEMDLIGPGPFALHPGFDHEFFVLTAHMQNLDPIELKIPPGALGMAISKGMRNRVANFSRNTQDWYLFMLYIDVLFPIASALGCLKGTPR